MDITTPIMPILTIMCYTGIMGTECKYQPECLSMMNYYSCYQRNFGDIRTREYNESVASGRNIKARLKQPNKISVKAKKYWVM